jgi:hypothetical protein
VSGNGTLLSGRRVWGASAPITDGDVISIGPSARPPARLPVSSQLTRRDSREAREALALRILFGRLPAAYVNEARVSPYCRPILAGDNGRFLFVCVCVSTLALPQACAFQVALKSGMDFEEWVEAIALTESEMVMLPSSS